MLVYLHKGFLPWSGLEEHNNQQMYMNMRLMKESVDFTKFQGGLPPCFEEYFQYVKNLNYDEQPDYNYLYNIWHSELKSS